jgi:thymidylate synthase
MNRTPIECQPKLILDTDKTDFYSFTIDDFRLEGYPLEEIKKKNPQVKLPLAI